jgi:hypothetical protein
MTWFWMNHFNVFQFKANLRAMVGDYEENAIRAHALGRFRDLLGATVRHPAMLRYLDNAQNGANRLNENYARELMELHTLGADGGYTQRDVQELARILTGVGIAITSNAPRISPGRQGDYVRTGAFEFNPNRHDYGDKVFLGRAVKGKGLAEVDEVLDRLARHPSTARFISRKLAVFFVSDEPPASLVDQMARAFGKTDGDIAATLRVLFHSPEFVASLGHKFKDPVHYVISGLRFTYDEQPIANAAPVLAWLNSLGQGLYNRQTPDGYPLTQTNWSGPGQMTARFEVARAIATGGRGLLGSDASVDVAFPKPPPFSRAPREDGIEKTLSASTVGALERARSAAEWYVYFLSAPEFMYRREASHESTRYSEDAGAGTARRVFTALCCGAGKLAIARRLPARWLRRRERARAARQHLLLRSASEYRRAQARQRTECSGGARHGLGAPSGIARFAPAAVSARAARIRAVCGDRRSFPQSFRNSGHDRAWPASRWQTHLQLGLPQ